MFTRSIKQSLILPLFFSSSIIGMHRFPMALKNGVPAKQRLLCTNCCSKKTQDPSPVGAEIAGAVIGMTAGGFVGAVGGIGAALALAHAARWEYHLPRWEEERRTRGNIVFGLTYGGALIGGNALMKAFELSPRTRVIALASSASLVALRAYVRDSSESIW